MMGTEMEYIYIYIHTYVFRPNQYRCTCMHVCAHTCVHKQHASINTYKSEPKEHSHIHAYAQRTVRYLRDTITFILHTYMHKQHTYTYTHTYIHAYSALDAIQEIQRTLPASSTCQSAYQAVCGALREQVRARMCNFLHVFMYLCIHACAYTS